MNHNDAFSAMKLDSHRHFLRLRILNDTVTVFPIKIDEVPGRGEWQENPEGEKDKFASVFSPKSAMRPKLIEEAIEIRSAHAPSTTDVKTPGEYPSRS